ncbi:hypothetical protein K1719_018754 [Acacia pycnantha]|nr:hypothetical protein K1719_018754 [Acacia pycnantha]
MIFGALALDDHWEYVGIQYPYSVDDESDDDQPEEHLKTQVRELLKELKLDEKAKQERCIVCLESFKDGDHVVAMPCNHIYHNKCIVEWFHRSFMCPLCRRN